VIPVTAVFSPEIEGQSYVWVIDESTNTVSQREVEIGALVSSGLAVQSGLESGEMIATAGVHFLREGQQVKPLVE
jgi:multidrug efflux pump subunit AcrA (membrane-fusion protein)